MNGFCELPSCLLTARRSGHQRRRAHWPAIAAALGTWFWATAAFAQLRDSFETPQPSWSLKQADCGVRELAHERTFREARSGQCEHFRLALGNGTFVYLTLPIGRAPLIQEFRPSLFLKADRASLQLLARVVFPRSLDPASGQPVTSFLRGDMYTEVGTWQQLGIRDVGRLLENEVRSLRSQLGREIDGREAYVDLIVLNAYAGPGPVDLWIDDLEIEGYVNLADDRAQAARRPAGSDARAAGNLPPTSAHLEGSFLLARGRPAMVRAIQHRGEPLAWLKGLGFNTVKLGSSPGRAELLEAQRQGLWLIAPPPYGDQRFSAEDLDPVLAWSLGSRLTQRDLPGTRALVDEIHGLDARPDRPLLASADTNLAEYSRLANLLLLEKPTLGTTHELADLRGWFLSRPRLAQPGTLVLAAVETQPTARLAQQLALFGRGAAWQDDCDYQQLRLAAMAAVAAGARGIVFSSEQPLAIDNGPAAVRTDALRLVNMELRLLEPWIAGGTPSEELSAGDGSVQASLLATERSRLLVITQHAAAQQYVLGAPPRTALSVLVPGVSVSDQAYTVSLAGVKPLKISHTSGGARIALDDASYAAAVVITQDPLAMHHLRRTLDEMVFEAARLRHDLAARRLAWTSQIDGQLIQLGHPLAQSTTWIQDAQAQLEQGRRLLETRDYSGVHAAVAKAELLTARVRRGHWEQTVAAFPSPAASPCIALFSTLPLHWSVAEQLRAALAPASGRGWGPNVQAAGDMESLDQMLAAGWQQERRPPQGIETDVSLTASEPHTGRTALHLVAWAGPQAAQTIEQPIITVASSPIPVREGQMVRIRGWANVPRPLAASSDGLLLFDSVGGPELGERIRLTQGWKEFVLYRVVARSGELRVTLALAGLGEALIDDLSVSLLDPEPIRPAK